jgi:DNA-directed RNA polymerase subunit RPC12/RpoP
MPEEIRCPECESLNVEEVLDKMTFAPEEPHDELAKETKPLKYECLDCRVIFSISNFKK